MRKKVKLGNDSYRTLIEKNCYYVDKTLLIQEFLDYDNEVTLITRPRRFGKTLNMTMMKEFFDISADSVDIFKGTKIMDTEYAKYLNTIPVIYFSFKDCDGDNRYELLESIRVVLKLEYDRYDKIFVDKNIISKNTLINFNNYLKKLADKDKTLKKEEHCEILVNTIPYSILYLAHAIYEYFDKKPIILLDEYDQPFMNARVKGFYDLISTTLSRFFVASFKGNSFIDKALLTGIQKIAQESIFSKFNNPFVCTVIDEEYSDKFGLTTDETREYLEYFNCKLIDDVKDYYDGYKFYETDIYNPLSISTYISKKEKLEPYWLNTSSNALIKERLLKADAKFFKDFDKLIKNGTASVNVDLSTTFSERPSNETLWGLFVNAGYITINKIIRRSRALRCEIKVPNTEVLSEFQKIVSTYTNLSDILLDDMFNALLDKDIEEFISNYKEIILSCTSYFDSASKENSYHMLMLGMCIYLRPRFEVHSNFENGAGRFDIMITPKHKNDLHVIIEFKYDNDKNLVDLSHEALKQIHEKKYYNGIKGQVLLLGIAYSSTEAEITYELI